MNDIQEALLWGAADWPAIAAALVAAVAAVGGLAAWMYRLGRDVGQIAEAVKGLAVLWERFDDHDCTLNEHNRRIARIEGHLQRAAE